MFDHISDFELTFHIGGITPGDVLKALHTGVMKVRGNPDSSGTEELPLGSWVQRNTQLTAQAESFFAVLTG